MTKILKKIILIILIIILCSLIYSKYILKNKFISLGGYGFLIVLTGSMEPEIKTGEFLIIKKCLEYEVGDIITYEDDNYITTHRIVSENSNGIITRGDSNNIDDKMIINNQILGKVVYHSEFLGFVIMNYLKSIIFILIVVILIINVIYVFKTIRDKGAVNIEKQK